MPVNAVLKCVLHNDNNLNMYYYTKYRIHNSHFLLYILNFQIEHDNIIDSRIINMIITDQLVIYILFLAIKKKYREFLPQKIFVFTKM